MRLPFLIFISAIALFAGKAGAQNQTDYDSRQWAMIDSLLFQASLPTDAAKALQSIQQKALKEKKQATLIKCLLYKIQISELREEDPWRENIRLLEQMATKGDYMVQALQQHYLALLYLHYMQRNPASPNPLTREMAARDGDVSTWNAVEYHQKIRALFLSSLRQKDRLQTTRMDKWNPLLLANPSTRAFKPTMYDLLAANALDYFKMACTDGTQPVDLFSIATPDFFSEAARFSRLPLPPSDSLSPVYQSLRLYQELLSFHIRRKDSLAWGDIDLQRIQFVYALASLQQRDSLYLSALQNIKQSFTRGAVADEATYRIAEWYANQAYQQPALASHYRQLSKQRCDEVIARNDSTVGKKNCLALRAELTQKRLEFVAEKVNLPDKPFRILVTYRNLPKIYFRLIPLPSREAITIKNAPYYKNEYWQNWAGRTPARQWHVPLPAGEDMHDHKTEIRVDALPVGSYLILGSADSSFSTLENQMAMQVTHVSAIGWMNMGNKFYIVDRQSGRPRPQALVDFWVEVKQEQPDSVVLQKWDQLITDTNGLVEKVLTFSYPMQPLLEITHGKDHLFLENEIPQQHVYSTTNKNVTHWRSFLYTDRAMYRPQQTVFFKGLVTAISNHVPKQAEPGLATVLYLTDPRFKTIDSIAITTSSWGSFTGSFMLPANSLPGMYLISDHTANVYASFRVEEYKRPRFTIVCPPPTGIYRLNDSITVNAKASSYAGNPISYARVTYMIKRRRPWLPLRRAFSPAAWKGAARPADQVITYGTTQTLADGTFRIRFLAEPESIDRWNPEAAYDFDVQAEITDMQGETQSAAIRIPVAQKGIDIVIDCPETMEADTLSGLKIFTQNRYGYPVQHLLHIRIAKLTPPLVHLRKRLWDTPDQFLLSQKDYREWFPLDEYGNESDPHTWAEEKEIMQTTDSSQATGDRRWVGVLPGPGWYKIDVSLTDPYGNVIRENKIFRREGPTAAGPLFNGTLHMLPTIHSPGDTVEYSLRTNMDSLWVISTISKNDTVLFREGNLLYTPMHEKISLTASDRGGVYLSAGFFRHNRFYSDTRKIEIPYSNKVLSIHYASFRGIYEPGASAQWRVRITNNLNKPVQAEVLSVLYDASLDQFFPHNWHAPALWSKSPLPRTVLSDQPSQLIPMAKNFSTTYFPYQQQAYEKLFPLFSEGLYEGGILPMPDVMGMEGGNAALRSNRVADNPTSLNNPINEQATNRSRKERVDQAAPANEQMIPLRKDFSETAFFLPRGVTDSNGEVDIAFRFPEAITRWKWMTLTHTKDLSFGYTDTVAITSKSLMAQANPPRFFREGDRMEYPVKISNTTDKELTGQVQLLLVDPETGQSVDGWFQNFFPNQYFTVEAGESIAASFSIEIPYRYNKPVVARVVARTAELSDGEEALIPVLSNRIMVTEARILPISKKEDTHFTLDKLIQSDQSATLHHHAITFEYTDNPFWYAVQNLPYLSSLPDESNDQLFLRWYANRLSLWVMKSLPELGSVIEKWKKADSLQLPSPLERNESLTGMVLEETPWVLQDRSARSLQHKMINYYSTNRAVEATREAADQLADLQNSDGSFSWFKGGPANTSITLEILTGLARLNHMGILDSNDTKIISILSKGMAYADRWVGAGVNARTSSTIPDKNIVHYLFLRSHFPEPKLPDSMEKFCTLYYNGVQNHWPQYSKMLQGMIALTCFRKGDRVLAKAIVRSLLQNAIDSAAAGLYWKEYNTAGYAWDESPIVAHTLLMQVMEEILQETAPLQKMKTWLLQQKQTVHWGTGRATAEACFALLKDAAVLQQDTTPLQVQLGTTVIHPKEQEAGTGFTRITIPGYQVRSDMGKVTIHFNQRNDAGNRMAWGALYWQYMDDLDKISPAGAPITMTKQLLVEQAGPKGREWVPLTEGGILHTGDKIMVQLTIRTNRNLSFVHLKDMRAASLEPAQVLSGHHWEKGMYYYQSNRDAAMHYYFDVLPRGAHVFTYTMYVQHKGTFQNGIASIQSMYAPAYESHTPSISFHVE